MHMCQGPSIDTVYLPTPQKCEASGQLGQDEPAPLAVENVMPSNRQLTFQYKSRT